MEALAATQYVFAEVARLVGLIDRQIQNLVGVRVFRTQIDVTLSGADGDSSDGHALDENERVALHEHAIGKGARIALVRIANDIPLVRWRVEGGFPFDPGWERSAATSP